MSSTRQALEDFLAANPDDLAAHSAYADWLTENNDPRGEYIRLQLALEDRNQPADRLRAMEQAAFTLHQRYEQEWLGPFYQYIYSLEKRKYQAEPVEPEADLRYRRGWIHEIETWTPLDEFWAALAATNLSRLICVLNVLTAPTLRTVQLLGWLKFKADFPNLQHLRINTDFFNDEHIDQLLESRVLDQLRVLDLSGCPITDDGALALARDPAVRKLKFLNLQGNLISPIGMEALAAIGVIVGQQDLGNQFDDSSYEV